jgi:hypothetical protein
MSDDELKLAYTFQPTSNPIRASAPGNNRLSIAVAFSPKLFGLVAEIKACIF